MDEIPVGFGDIQGVERGEPGGVIYQAVEPSEVLTDILEQALDVSNTFEIRLKYGGVAAFGRGLTGFRFPNCCNGWPLGRLRGPGAGRFPALCV